MSGIVVGFPIVPLHCVACGGLAGAHALNDCPRLLRRRAAPHGSAEPSGSEKADGSALLRSVGSTAGAGADKEKEDRVVSTIPATIIPHPHPTAQAIDETYKPATLSRERAYCLKWRTFQVAEAFVGTDGLSLDLSTYRCGLCEGKFPATGRAMFFLDQRGTFVPIHRGCYRLDVDAWQNSGEDEPA